MCYHAQWLSVVVFLGAFGHCKSMRLSRDVTGSAVCSRVMHYQESLAKSARVVENWLSRLSAVPRERARGIDQINQQPFDKHRIQRLRRSLLHGASPLALREWRLQEASADPHYAAGLECPPSW